MKRYNKSKKNSLKKKNTKKYQKGGSNCAVNIPQTINSVVNTGNCNIGGNDCFNNPLPLPQLGILPTSPNLSEVAFNGRYCCGANNTYNQSGGDNYSKLQDGIISSKIILGIDKNINFYVSDGRFSTEGINKKEAENIQKILKKKKINSQITGYALGGSKLYFENKKLHAQLIKNKSFTQFGGNGYYLSLDSCAPGGLSTVKGYDNCCPPVFSGKLTDNMNNYVYNPFQNQYYTPALQPNIQVKTTQGGKKKKKNHSGGNGYYLSLDSCAPGGLSTVKGYDSCCPPVFSGKLSGNINNYSYNPFQNKYYTPALQPNIQVKNTIGGNKKTKNKKGKKGGYTTLGFKTYPSYCDGKENWSQCGTSNSSCSNSGGKKIKR